jgi:hypothetical protein
MAQQSRLSRTQKASDNGHRDRGDRRRLVSRRHASLSISRVDIVVEMLVHVARERATRSCVQPES